MRRDWRDAVAHHDGKGCRVCLRFPRELAHIIPREHDWIGLRNRRVVRVHPLAVCPLCGHHHALYDSHQFDLLPHLTADEIGHAVSVIGEGNALRRIQGARLAA